ncbi:MAG: hypothetical protein AB7S48_08165 [Bacteroidales bacterium]
MTFDTDKQTLSDLDLLEREKGAKSILSLFNHTQSIGGYEMLRRTFSSPIADSKLLENRVEAIKYFEKTVCCFNVDKVVLDFIEFYLIQDKKPTRLSLFNIIRKSIDHKLRPSNKTYLIKRGILYFIKVVNDLYDFVISIDDNDVALQVVDYKKRVIDIVENTNLKNCLNHKGKKRLNSIWVGKYDYFFRYSEFDKVRTILDVVYEIDMLQSVSTTISQYGFSYPKFKDSEESVNIVGLFHPFVENCVPNDLRIDYRKNICFLTGPNMAGKSTYLKSFGDSIYLAHIGFPVPAKSMETSVFRGLFSSINLADNINKGYSHYYGEVLRVKYIAEKIYVRKNVVVIFDELFRGTNVKDAYEASLAVISAFAKVRKSIFAISTHIIEVADTLDKHSCIDFKYFEIIVGDGIPSYTYTLKNGVTNDRLGLYILNREKVIETIENSI